MNLRDAGRNTGRIRAALLTGYEPYCGRNAELNRTDLNRTDLSSLSLGSYVVLPTVDRSLTAVDVHASRMIQPARIDELAALAIGGQR